MSHTFGVVSKMLSLHLRSSRLSPVLSLMGFVIVCFTFRAVLYFKFILVMGVNSVSIFLLLQKEAQLFQHHFLKRRSLLHCITFAHLSKIR